MKMLWYVIFCETKYFSTLKNKYISNTSIFEQFNFSVFNVGYTH